LHGGDALRTCAQLHNDPAAQAFCEVFGHVRLPCLARAYYLQALADGAEDPEAALQRAGLYFNGGAVAYLTPAQKAVLLAELENMEARELALLCRPSGCAVSLVDLRVCSACCFCGAQWMQPSTVLQIMACNYAAELCLWLTLHMLLHPRSARQQRTLPCALQVTLGYDMAAYYVTDCLLRARFTNNRMEVARRF